MLSLQRLSETLVPSTAHFTTRAKQHGTTPRFGTAAPYRKITTIVVVRQNSSAPLWNSWGTFVAVNRNAVYPHTEYTNNCTQKVILGKATLSKIAHWEFYVEQTCLASVRIGIPMFRFWRQRARLPSRPKMRDFTVREIPHT